MEVYKNLKYRKTEVERLLMEKLTALKQLCVEEAVGSPILCSSS